MVSPAVIMGAIFNFSLDLIGLKKIELFKYLRNCCQKNCGFLKKNSRIAENFFEKKLLTRQKLCSFVTQGKMLP